MGLCSAAPVSRLLHPHIDGVRNGVVLFTKWGQVMRVVPPAECVSLCVVEMFGRPFAGSNGAFGAMLFLENFFCTSGHMTGL